MNYCTLTLNDTKIGLKFGMASYRYLSTKLVEGKTHQGADINEIGIAHILYSGYFNNCLIKDVEPDYSFEVFAEWLEQNLTNDEAMNQVKAILELWTNNQFVQKALEPEAKKKTTPLKKSKPSPSGK
jgi:hypothetical protein